jgi:hypothetical protein
MAFLRRDLGPVCASTSSLCVLLAALLLVSESAGKIDLMISDWIHTSNDFLWRFMEKHVPSPPGYHIIAQSLEDTQNVENAPAFSMEPHLHDSGQIDLLRTISIYSLRGESREQMRLPLYECCGHSRLERDGKNT